MRIVVWLKGLFKKVVIQPKVEVRYLFDEVSGDLKSRKDTLAISDISSVIVKSKGAVIGQGLGIASSFELDKNDNNYVSASIADLVLVDDSYELRLDDSFEIQYRSVGYDTETNIVKSDISFIFEDATLLSNEKLICHKSKIKVIEIERI